MAADPQPEPVVREAISYFNLQAYIRANATLDGTADPPNGDAQIQELIGNGPLGPNEAHKKLGLTGNIISATAHIPYTVEINSDGHFEISPRESPLVKSLAYLSSSTSFQHTIVGWTGKINNIVQQHDAKSPIRERSATDTDASGKLGNVTIHGADNANLKGAFADRMKGSEAIQAPLSITKAQRTELETLLENAFQDKVSPVWLGDWSETDEGTLLLKDQGRWHKLAKAFLNPQEGDVVALDSMEEALADYRRMNESVADAILKLYQPGDIVWIHDTNLMLLPSLLRKKLPSAYICYYHNITDPIHENAVLVLMMHKELMTGILGASAIGVPSRELRQDFVEYYKCQLQVPVCDGMLHASGHKLAIFSVPVVSHAQKLLPPEAAFAYKARDQMIEARYRDQQIIVVLASSNEPGAMQTVLSGFEQLLKSRKDRNNDMVLVLINDPKPSQSEHVHVLRQGLNPLLSQQITSINGEYGTALLQPVIYLSHKSKPEDVTALMRRANLCLIATGPSTEEIMGVEVLVSQKDRYSPLLICDHVPNGTEPSFKIASKVAEQMNYGLKMTPDEQKSNHKLLFDWLAKRDFKTFTDEFLRRACDIFLRLPPVNRIPPLDVASMLNAYLVKDQRLFMIDFDGTLTPIVNDPEAAIPTEELLVALGKLAAKPSNQVWLISGRARGFLQKHFGGVAGVGLSAEHGSFIRRPGTNEWENLSETTNMSWKKEVEVVYEQLCGEVENSWIERKEVAMVWHYRNAVDHDACLAKAVEAKALLDSERLKDWDVDVMLGKANLEVRPAFLNKGAMSASLIKDMFGNGEEGFVLCAGDDTTDEDMFRAILGSKLAKAGVFSCLVSNHEKPSLASFRVEEPHNLVEAVVKLSELEYNTILQ